jgi:hypothetical protein
MALPDMLDPGYEQPVVRRAPDSPLDLPTTSLTPQPVVDRAPRRVPSRWIGEARAYSPTMREKSVARVQDVLEERLGVDRPSAIRMAETVLGGPGSNLPLGVGLIDIPLAPSVPFLMEESARSVGQAGRAFEQGDYSGALASYGAAVLQGIPGVAALKILTPVVARGAQQILSESLTRGGRQGQRGIFLAEKWWTPQEQAARRVAEDLEAQGATAEDVLIKTGLVRDLDGTWAVEISDDAMKFRGLEAVRAARATVAKRADDIEAAMRVREILDSGGTVDNAVRDYRVRMGAEPSKEILRLAEQRDAEQLEAAMQNTMASLTAPIKGLRLQDVIEHPELFERIPDLADMQVDFLLQKDLSPGAVAQYTPGAPGSIQLLSKTLSGAPGAARLDIGHELQHTVDFPVGGTRGYGTSVVTMNLADEQLRRSTQNAADMLTTFENAQAVRRLMDANPGMSADAAFDRLLDEGNYFGSSQDYAKPGVTVNPETGQKYTELGSKRNPVLDIAAVAKSTELDQAVKEAIDAVKQAYSKEKDVTRTPPFQRYMSERGEARARLTERRMDLTPEERRQVFPMRAGTQAMDMPPEQTKSLYELTGGLYGLRGQSAAMPSASMGAEAPPAGPPLRDLLPNEPTTLRTLENLPQNRPYIPISTIREQLRRADVTKAEKDVLESIIAGRDDFIGAEELVNAVRARSKPFRLSPADTQDFADYGFDRIGRDTTGRPWVGRGPNASNARTTVHRSPTVTSPDNHFDDPFYFGHTRAFEDAQGIPHVVEIQSDLVQRAAKELTEAERTSLEEGVRAIDDQRKIIDSLVKSTPFRLNYYDDAADLFEKTLPKLEELNPDAKFMIGRYLLNAPGVRGQFLDQEGAVEYVLRVLRDDWAGTERSAASSALRNALDDFNYDLDVRRYENKSKLATKAEATAQRPMFKNWERRLIREEISRAAGEHEDLPNKISYLEREIAKAPGLGIETTHPAIRDLQRKLDQTRQQMTRPPVIRFADADAVARVEGWPKKLDITPGDEFDATLRGKRLSGSLAGTVNDWKYTGHVRVDEGGMWEAERIPIDVNGNAIGNPVWSNRGSTNISQSVVDKRVKESDKLQFPEHQGIYDRYNKEVANYLKSLGGKRVTDDQGVGWWEVPVKPQQKRVQLFSMGGGAVTVGGGVAAPGDFGYTVPTEED